jgi:competence protein ComEC
MWKSSLAALAGAAAAQLTSFAPVEYALDRVFLVCLVACLVFGRAVGAGFGIGAFAFWLAALAVLDDRLEPAFAGDNILTRVEVIGFPARRDGTVQMLVRPVAGARLPGRIRLGWRSPPATPRAGDVWELVVRLRVPRSVANPGGYDAEAWLFREGVGATGYVVESPRNRLLKAGAGGAVLGLRRAIAGRIEQRVGSDSVSAVLIAITVGARHRLSDDQWQRYARTGTSHLMAISGLHIGLAATATYLLASLLLLAGRYRGRNRRVAFGAAVAVASVYTLLSGFGVPALRALVMLSVGVLAWSRARAIGSFDAWALALLVVVLAAPLRVGSAGFLLSFAAVLLLLWSARQSGFRYQTAMMRRSVGTSALLVRLQFVLLLGLLPLVLVLFDRVAPAAPLVNLVLVPLFSIVTVPAALAGVALSGPLAPLGDALIGVAAWTVAVSEAFMAGPGWPDGGMGQQLGATGIACALMAASWALLPRGWPGRWLSLPAVLAIAVWQPERVPAGCLRVTVLDVGQGQAIVVETRSSSLLYDTGPGWPGGRDAMSAIVLPYLRYRGIDALATTVVSHSDLDHAGGLETLRAALPTGRILAGEPIDAVGMSAANCHAVRPWQLDGVRFAFLAAAVAERLEGNNRSCVLEISYGSNRVLLPGDIERPVEEALADAGVLRPVTLVSIPHHGSRTSSSTAFIDATRPALAVASAAYGNRWGFPKPAIVRRWESYGAVVHATAGTGAVVVTLCAGRQPIVHLERLSRQRLWHSP